MSKMPFDEYTAERRKVVKHKKDGLYWYVSFGLHRSDIKKGWIDATFV